MTEQEEFEFRLRLEQEQGAQKPAAQPITTTSKVARGMTDPFEGGGQLLYNLLPRGVQQAGDRLNNWLADKGLPIARIPDGGMNQLVRDNEANYQAQRAAAGESGFDGWRAAGNIASPANLLIASRVPQAASLTGRVAGGVGTGALFGSMTPVTGGDYWGEKTQQVAIGGAAGGALPAVAGGVARVVSPKASTNPDVIKLRKAGITPTIGQALGGAANATEQKMSSLPLVGDAIINARRNAVQQFNKAAINRTVAPIGQQVDDIGHAGITKAGDMLSKSYDDALGMVKGVTLDQQGLASLANIRQMATYMPSDKAKPFTKFVNDRVIGRMSQRGGMQSDTFKIVDSELGKKIASTTDKELRDAYTEVQNVLRESVARQSPAFAEALKKSREGWANLVRVEGAGKAAANQEGIFSPAQLMSAVRQADTSVRDRATARGSALMQDLAGAGQRVLGNTYPDSGTVGRAALIGTGVAGVTNPVLTVGGLAAGAGLYTPAIQKALVNMATTRPQLAAEAAKAIRKSTPFLTPGAVPLGYGLLGPSQ